MATFDLYSIYNNTFGYRFVAGKYSTSVQDVVVDSSSEYSNKIGDGLDIAERTSMLGTPLLMPMKLNSVYLPVEPIVTINLKKRIIETELDDVDGSFKEGFSNGDYDITIQGVIIDDNDFEQEEYPEKKVREFRKLVTDTVTKDANSKALSGLGNIDVTHKILNIFGIYKIVVFECEWVQIAGQIGMQGYTLTCKSDKTRKLKLK